MINAYVYIREANTTAHYIEEQQVSRPKDPQEMLFPQMLFTLATENVHRDLLQPKARHTVQTVKAHGRGLQCYEESPREDPVVL